MSRGAVDVTHSRTSATHVPQQRNACDLSLIQCMCGMTLAHCNALDITVFKGVSVVCIMLHLDTRTQSLVPMFSFKAVLREAYGAYASRAVPHVEHGQPVRVRRLDQIPSLESTGLCASCGLVRQGWRHQAVRVAWP
jgi:hypothetical protein